MSKVPQHYVPKYLSKKDRQKVKKELIKSRTAYKKNKYYSREKVKGFKKKKSKWTNRVKKIYGLDLTRKISVNKLLTDGEEGRFVASSIFEYKMQNQFRYHQRYYFEKTIYI